MRLKLKAVEVWGGGGWCSKPYVNPKPSSNLQEDVVLEIRLTLRCAVWVAHLLTRRQFGRCMPSFYSGLGLQGLGFRVVE